MGDVGGFQSLLHTLAVNRVDHIRLEQQELVESCDQYSNYLWCEKLWLFLYQYFSKNMFNLNIQRVFLLDDSCRLSLSSVCLKPFIIPLNTNPINNIKAEADMMKVDCMMNKNLHFRTLQTSLITAN